jgi:hypothetical protein
MFGFGRNVKVKPLSIAAVEVISSPTVIPPLPAAAPEPTNEPAFLFANTTVYPDCVFPLGEVVGERVT